jgi:hypothetical protein
MQNQSTGFKWKYLAIWYGSCVALSAVYLIFKGLINAKDTTTSMTTVVFTFPTAMLIFTVFALGIEVYKQGWKFGAIMHSSIVWYIYPFTAPFKVVWEILQFILRR